MRTHFYNAKVNNVWQEVYTNGDRGDKKEALKIFNKFDKNIKLKDVYSAINTPYGCPDTFSKSLNELL
jgi:hypothetical protein